MKKRHLVLIAGLAIFLVAAVSMAGDRAREVKIDIDNGKSLLVITEDGVRHDIERPLKIPTEGPLGIVIVDGTGGDHEGLGDELAIGFLSIGDRDILGVTRLAENLASLLLADGDPTITAAVAAGPRGDGSMDLQQAGALQGAQPVSATWSRKTFRKTCPAGCSWPDDFECCEIYGCSGLATDCIEIVFDIQQR